MSIVEPKAFLPEFKFEGTKLIAGIAIDSNKDGQPSVTLKLEVELSEIPDEVFAAISAKKTV